MVRCRLSELGDVVTGTTPSTRRPELYGDYFPLLKPTDLTGDDPRLPNFSFYLSKKGYHFAKRRLVPAGSVGVVCIGTLGDAVYINQPTITNQAINTIVPNSDVCHGRFLYYLVKEQVIPALKKLDSGTASGREYVNKSVFSDIEVELPSLDHQRRIASILSAYDDLIENNLRRIKILEEMAQLLYREWFVHYRYPGHEGVELVDSELGPIPKGWEVASFGALCTQERRGIDPADVPPETPYIGLEHMPKKSIALGEWGRADSVGSSKLRFTSGDILFGKIRPYFHKVGVACVDGVASSDAIIIKPRSPALFALTLCVASSDAFIASTSQSAQGTKMPRANWDVMCEYPVALPPSAVMHDFNQAAAPMIALIQNMVHQGRALRQARDLLLPRLISGELDVSELDIEVSA